MYQKGDVDVMVEESVSGVLIDKKVVMYKIGTKGSSKVAARAGKLVGLYTCID